ncbi:VOC family protein [Kangiella sediminilitoris]|uniref:Glyoxalase/bleomycin resistance protein/dioxygenase n=1 Tax=Kangiella sediminilitoris TaxID=1144748 RepID=A0A1B3BAC5_9GAMM|nr:VOC family protein [Kangiella sediminilitoris]AOE49757.1 Glyoxalase/bleomycin resistance protein/dioxygenase [Kangiella sediminilitoris]
MGKVIGLGGVFFKSKNRKSLAAWYRDTLGLEIDPSYGGTHFMQANAPKNAYTVWSPFTDNTDYFQPSSKEFMINFIVDNVDECLTQVVRNGGQTVGNKTEDEFGIFGWFMDPEGNKIELWQPNK